MGLEPNQLYQGDCLNLLAKLEPGAIDLAFADPPFNIGYKYDVYEDRKADGDYLDWSRQWITGVHRALSPTGTFWLAIGDEYAAELKWIATRDVGFSCRSWVIWYYTFGVNCTRKFNRSHVHLFHFVKDPQQFTFNADDPAVRVPSARQLVYADGRANPRGRLPDDTWILRPQDLPEGFQPSDDTWYFPRVAGTFKERAGFHGCQMPERLLARIVLVSSKPGDTVLDPFAGSGSTLAVAKKLGREWMGFELSKEYVRLVRKRMDRVSPGDPLDGTADPIVSAPPTPNKVNGTQPHETRFQPAATRANSGFPTSYKVRSQRLQGVQTDRSVFDRRGAAEHRNRPSPNEDEKEAIRRAFFRTHQGFATDALLADPSLNAAFCEECRRHGLPGQPRDWNHWLINLRKAKLLPRATQRRVVLRTREVDAFIFASEIAMQDTMLTSSCTLDDVLCDPELARRFDEYARRLAPGYESLHYRWGALRIRKRGRDKVRDMEMLSDEERRCSFSKKRSDIDSTISKFEKRDSAGVYLLASQARGEALYIGETFSLANRLRIHRSTNIFGIDDECRIACLPVSGWDKADKGVLAGRHALMVTQLKPRYNFSLEKSGYKV